MPVINSFRFCCDKNSSLSRSWCLVSRQVSSRLQSFLTSDQQLQRGYKVINNPRWRTEVTEMSEETEEEEGVVGLESVVLETNQSALVIKKT